MHPPQTSGDDQQPPTRNPQSHVSHIHVNHPRRSPCSWDDWVQPIHAEFGPTSSSHTEKPQVTVMSNFSKRPHSRHSVAFVIKSQSSSMSLCDQRQARMGGLRAQNTCGVFVLPLTLQVLILEPKEAPERSALTPRASGTGVCGVPRNGNIPNDKEAVLITRRKSLKNI